MSRYKYTCPDVVHYRKNQYRLAIWSNVFSLAWMAVFFGGLSVLAKRAKNTDPVETPTENQE